MRSVLLASMLAMTGLLQEPDPMAIHDDERPPNAAIKGLAVETESSPPRFTERLILPAPAPELRARPPALPDKEEWSPEWEPTPAETYVEGVPLTEDQVRRLLTAGGWPDSLHEQALRVSYGESVRWKWWVTSYNGCCGGLFQLHFATWAPYCGVEPEQLYDPFINVSCAWRVYQYDIARGYEPWTQWEVKPW